MTRCPLPAAPRETAEAPLRYKQLLVLAAFILRMAPP